jgi:hypothetical protein
VRPCSLICPLLPYTMNVRFQWMSFYFQGKRAIYGDDSKLHNGYSNCTNGVSGVSNGESKKFQWVQSFQQRQAPRTNYAENEGRHKVS